MLRTHPKSLPLALPARGFSLIEVLVSLIIISVGLLGIAKIQALAYASSGTSNLRSLAAIEASSLASAMRANRAYWAAGTAPASFTISGTTISNGTLAGIATSCLSGSTCNATAVAAYDLHQWANGVAALLPTPVTTIACPTAVQPINCTIQITWTEKNAVGINNEGAVGPAMQAATYTLYVEP